MVLKCKKIYINEKFKSDISNNIISYDLISDIFFTKKNSKVFRHGFFWFYTILILAILLSIFSFVFNAIYWSSNRNDVRYLYFAISLVLFSSSMWAFAILYSIFLDRQTKDNKKIYLTTMDILKLYLELICEIGTQKVKNTREIIKCLSKFSETSNLNYITENDLDIKKKNKILKLCNKRLKKGKNNMGIYTL